MPWVLMKMKRKGKLCIRGLHDSDEDDDAMDADEDEEEG